MNILVSSKIQAQPLMIVHHRHLVSLIGYCDDIDNMALIYELVEKGNLHKHLSGIRYIR